jgi:hypothetical protein
MAPPRVTAARRWLVAALLGAGLAVVAPGALAQDEYRFDVSEFEKKAFEFSGYTELRAEHFRLQPGAALYQLNLFDQPRRTGLDRFSAAAEFSGIYRRGIATFQATAHADAQHDALDSDRSLRLYEGYLTLEPATGTRLEAGKRALRWGKGYAWNPVGFVERPKDPNDPELSREGFVMLAGSVVRSFDGPLQNASVTAALVPTGPHLNKDFGSGSHLNPAVKLSVLYRDTDVDFVALGQGARSARYGVDFSRNFGTNLEVHGEWARIRNNRRALFNPAGPPTMSTAHATSYLLGLRYLTQNDTTWIAEYYRNGTGYGSQEMRDWFTAAHSASAQYEATGDAAALARARTVQGSYARPNSMSRYLYLRASQKEPFDILYFTPSVTAIVNLSDRSYSLAPELLYTGFANVELRARFFFIHGGRLSEFGEKQNSRRLELRARLSF